MAQRLGPDLPETYIRGQKTVDHAYGSPRLGKSLGRAGSLAFNDGIVTNHRGFFLDFNRKTFLFGGNDQNLETREGRLLTTNNKHGASQCRIKSSEAIFTNNILRRLHKIEQKALTGFSLQVKQELEEVDTELHNILLDAEKNIATYSYLPWSPKLHNAYQVWKYWKTRLSYYKTKHIPGQRIKELLKK
eukprot:scaffold100819_cov35-Attheya_sp.AAC.1